MSKVKLLLLPALILSIWIFCSFSLRNDFQLIQLTSTSEDEYFCSWSPDSNKILYNSNYQLWILDLKDKSKIQLTKTGINFGGEFNPYKKKIAFVKIEESGRHIWVMDADGENQTPLTTDLRNTECGGFRWSPDGKKIAFSTFIFRNNTSEEWSIWVMDADGNNKKKIADGLFPEWISEDEVAWITNKGELWRMNVDR